MLTSRLTPGRVSGHGPEGLPRAAIRPVPSSWQVRVASHPIGPAIDRQPCAVLRSRRRWQGQQVRRAAEPSGSPSSPQQDAATDAPPEEHDFDLLSTRIRELTTELKEELRGCSIYLIGMMGSGKSTVGKMLANTLKYAFFDTDVMIEMAHEKKPIAAIFTEYGQDYFRGCESEVLKQLAPYKNLVVATGGGAVIKPMNWSYLHAGVTAWLNGPTDLLARRVAKDGIEKRPLLVGDATPATEGAEPPSSEELYARAKAKLDGLLEERTKFYENADLVISLEGTGADVEAGAPTAVVMYRLLQALKLKIDATKAEREERRNFTIERAGEVPTMRTQPAPGAAQQDGPASAA